MQIKRIQPGQWYQTKVGIGKCLSNAGKHLKFLIDGKDAWLSSSDVQHEIARGEEPQEADESPPRILPRRPPQDGDAITKKERTDAARIAHVEAVNSELWTELVGMCIRLKKLHDKNCTAEPVPVALASLAVVEATEKAKGTA